MSQRRKRFAEGTGYDAWRYLGAHPAEVGGQAGYRFRVWAPRARRVSVIGTFNDWQPAPMQRLADPDGGGCWALFVPGAAAGQAYKFRVDLWDGSSSDRADPFAFAAELRPATASILARRQHRWRDGEWMSRRAAAEPWAEPISIYELHLASWMRHGDGSMYSYREIADRLIAHVHQLGFTHVELLPLTEHPYDPSWGYQCTGYFAPTARHGTPDDLRYLVDRLHRAGIGVIVDWVPAHFPRDAHALASFDGQPLYEHPEPSRGEHPDWGTLIFDFGRPEVRSFLIASACYWIETLHVDGLRVDAVASMVYLDYSRAEGAWQPNLFGGNQNLEAISLLQDLNRVIRARYPGVVTWAEESTAFPRVTSDPPPPFSAWDAGLGFHFKWNMGWMHDTLSYFREDPIHRCHHHGKLTFPAMYAHSEAYALPLSHDEVVHGKGSLVRKMAGDWRDGLQQLRLLFALQWTWPGKKLLFAGGEFGQDAEWDFDRELSWAELAQPQRAALARWVARLNALYRAHPALHAGDCDPRGFRWIEPDDNERSIISYERVDPSTGAVVVVVINFVPVERSDFVLRLPRVGTWRVVADAAHPDGGDDRLLQATLRDGVASTRCALPGLSALILTPGAET